LGRILSDATSGLLLSWRTWRRSSELTPGSSDRLLDRIERSDAFQHFARDRRIAVLGDVIKWWRTCVQQKASVMAAPGVAQSSLGSIAVALRATPAPEPSLLATNTRMPAEPLSRDGHHNAQHCLQARGINPGTARTVATPIMILITHEPPGTNGATRASVVRHCSSNGRKRRPIFTASRNACRRACRRDPINR
jgi:hypothetical protein